MNYPFKTWYSRTIRTALSTWVLIRTILCVATSSSEPKLFRLLVKKGAMTKVAHPSLNSFKILKPSSTMTCHHSLTVPSNFYNDNQKYYSYITYWRITRLLLVLFLSNPSVLLSRLSTSGNLLKVLMMSEFSVLYSQLLLGWLATWQKTFWHGLVNLYLNGDMGTVPNTKYNELAKLWEFCWQLSERPEL